MINEIRDEFITIHDAFTDFLENTKPYGHDGKDWERQCVEFHSFVEEVFETVKKTVAPYTESWKEAFERGFGEGLIAGSEIASDPQPKTNMEKWGF